MRSIRANAIFLSLILTLCLPSISSIAQEEGMEDASASPEIQTWDLPGSGAGPIVVSPADGSIWTFFHQTGNLVALDPSDGAVLIDVPLTIRPTALDFCQYGMGLFLVGEPLDDQIIDRGVVQAIDASNGDIVAELELVGACNAVYTRDFETVYVACGMQYGYEGILYKLAVEFDDEGSLTMHVEYQTSCGKIPWSIASFNGAIYVTDLELQWTAQPNGTMGPPYGALVWAYDEDTLELLDKSWVGINPSKLAEFDDGILVACSGSKQGEGNLIEPAFSIISDPGESDPYFVGTAGVGDIAVALDGEFAVGTLSDWGPPAQGSVMSNIEGILHGDYPDARRWVFTSDLALIDLTAENRVSATRLEGISESYLRDIAFSLDGEYIYALQGEPEKFLLIPIEIIIGD